MASAQFSASLGLAFIVRFMEAKKAVWLLPVVVMKGNKIQQNNKKFFQQPKRLFCTWF